MSTTTAATIPELYDLLQRFVAPQGHMITGPSAEGKTAITLSIVEEAQQRGLTQAEWVYAYHEHHAQVSS